MCVCGIEIAHQLKMGPLLDSLSYEENECNRASWKQLLFALAIQFVGKVGLSEHFWPPNAATTPGVSTRSVSLDSRSYAITANIMCNTNHCMG